jgi:CubicO group peptidase (beta-lactamase class C family)
MNASLAAGRRLTSSGLAGIEEVARTHLERGWHSGAQLAVYRDGVLQLDLRLGTASHEGARLLWFSATKPLTAVAVLQLAERGALDLDRPIAELWPEFAQGGKAGVTPRHVLTHRGGFPVLGAAFDWARIDDWSYVSASVAALRASWEPGSEVGYHPVTFGFALGEVIRRADGRMPRDYLREEIFEPLGMDASLGLEEARHGELVPPEAMSEVTFQDPEGTEARTSDIVRRFRLASTLRGQVPAANAIGTADALARFYAALERGGELDGVRILEARTVAEATRVHATADIDRVTGLPSSFGLGFMVGGPFEPWCEPSVFGHSGQQCTVSYADRARGVAVAYVTNGLHDPGVVQARTEELVGAVRAASDAAGGRLPAPSEG